MIDHDESKNLPKMTLSDENVTPELEYEMLGWSQTFATATGIFTDNGLSPAKLIIRVVSYTECQGQFNPEMLNSEINVCARINNPGYVIPEVITCIGLIILKKLYEK